MRKYGGSQQYGDNGCEVVLVYAGDEWALHYYNTRCRKLLPVRLFIYIAGCIQLSELHILGY